MHTPDSRRAAVMGNAQSSLIEGVAAASRVSKRSKGMRKKVGIVVAEEASGRLLDAPTSGLDP